MRHFICFYESMSPTRINFRVLGNFGVEATTFPNIVHHTEEQAKFIREKFSCEDANVTIMNVIELSEQDYKSALGLV